MELNKTPTGDNINTHNIFVDFGKYKGERWTRLPLSYLKFLINADTQYRDIARAEIARRGTNLDGGIELSAHAIDRASLLLQNQWKQWREKDEGLYSWLNRMCKEALKYGFKMDDTYLYHNMKFIFNFGALNTTLKTVFSCRPVIKKGWVKYKRPRKK